MLKRFRYFMKLAVEYNSFFVNAKFFPKVMEVWCITNNDISIATLHCKLFKMPYSFTGVIAADIPSSSTKYDHIIFQKIISLKVGRSDNSISISTDLGQTYHTAGAIKTVKNLLRQAFT